MQGEQRELTDQQLHGLIAMVALAVFFTVTRIFISLGEPSPSLSKPFFPKEKGALAIALNMDTQERGVFLVPPGTTVAGFMTNLSTTILLKGDGGIGSRKLLAGDKVYLNNVVSSSPVVGRMSAAQSLALDLPMDINKASFEDLVLVPGIGEKTAAQIIGFRVAQGRFRNLDELKALNGIREKKFDKLKNYFFAVPER